MSQFSNCDIQTKISISSTIFISYPVQAGGPSLPDLEEEDVISLCPPFLYWFPLLSSARLVLRGNLQKLEGIKGRSNEGIRQNFGLSEHGRGWQLSLEGGLLEDWSLQAPRFCICAGPRGYIFIQARQVPTWHLTYWPYFWLLASGVPAPSRWPWCRGLKTASSVSPPGPHLVPGKSTSNPWAIPCLPQPLVRVKPGCQRLV